MKAFLILFASFLFVQPFQQTKLKGIYKMNFEQKYGLDGYKITFNEDTFTKTNTDAVTSRGKIAYGKFITTLSMGDEVNPIEIDNRELSKDTMRFTTKSKRDLSLTINRGVMIRVK